MESRPLLVASDIGGTLSHEKNVIPDFCVRILNRLMSQDIPVVLVTGYNYRTACEYARNLDKQVGILASNGTIAVQSGQMLWEHRIPEPQARELFHFLRDFGYPVFVYKGKDENFQNYICTSPVNYGGDGYLEWNEFNGLHNTIGLSIRVPSEELDVLPGRIRMVIQDQFRLIISRGKSISWLEITPLQAKKDLALKQYCWHYSLPISRVIYFGDNLNDLDVLKAVGHPIIVENSVGDLKKVFKSQVPPAEKNGVAHYLNDIFGLGMKEPE